MASWNHEGAQPSAVRKFPPVEQLSDSDLAVIVARAYTQSALYMTPREKDAIREANRRAVEVKT